MIIAYILLGMGFLLFLVIIGFVSYFRRHQPVDRDDVILQELRAIKGQLKQLNKNFVEFLKK